MQCGIACLAMVALIMVRIIRWIHWLKSVILPMKAFHYLAFQI